MDNCKHVIKMKPARDHSVLNPQKWHCMVCGTTESVWNKALGSGMVATSKRLSSKKWEIV
ncbi:hypothetical protein LSH36_231g01000 [Paralvinella palmiformis]|uniref:UBP-type domain-containing protein n=1 Tax=Paralvinella palmiformis TaxID=53620 RepID=A0AAD9N3W9_9ANNE|nr:hypothetical protein LSH36_231g01000 [Paralvinella palmiformis]